MRLVAAGLLALCLALASEARAQPTVDESGALALGHEALDLFEKKRWDDAYDRFAAADRLAHSPVFILYMARCRREAGALLAARALFDRAATEPVPATAPEPWTKARADAAVELAAVEKAIPRAVVGVKGAAGAKVTIDGKPADAGAPVALDPGDHTVEATAGDRHASRRIHVDAGGAPLAVELDLTPASKPPPPPPPPAEKRRSALPGAVTIGVGLAGVGLGVIAGLMSQSRARDVKKGCNADGHCLATDASKASSAETLATVANVGFVAGGVVTAGGIVLVVTRPF